MMATIIDSVVVLFVKITTISISCFLLRKFTVVLFSNNWIIECTFDGLALWDAVELVTDIAILNTYDELKSSTYISLTKVNVLLHNFPREDRNNTKGCKICSLPKMFLYQN